MLIFSAIPNYRLLCVNVFDRVDGSLIEEFQFDLANRQASWIRFNQDKPSMVTSEMYSRVLSGSLVAAFGVMVSCKVSDLQSAYQVSRLLSGLDRPIELQLERQQFAKLLTSLDVTAELALGAPWGDMVEVDQSQSILQGKRDLLLDAYSDFPSKGCAAARS